MRALALGALLGTVGCYRSHPPAAGLDAGEEPGPDAGVHDASCSPPLEPAPRREELGPPLGPLPADDCEPGSLAGLDPTGEWWVFLLPEGAGATDPDDTRFDGARPLTGLEVVRFEPGCAPPAARMPLTSEAADPVRQTPDELLWVLQEGTGDGAVSFALDACRRSAKGRLGGSWAVCFAHGCARGTAALERLTPPSDEPEADGLTRIGRWTPPDPRPTWDVDLLGTLAAVARGPDGIRFVALDDPAHPREVGHFVHDRAVSLVRAELADAGDGTTLALVESLGDGVLVVDVSDPAQPRQLFTLGDRAAAVATATDGGRLRAYVLDPGTLERTVWDLSDPATPELLESRTGAFCAPLRLSFGAGVLWAGCGDAGLLGARATEEGATDWRWTDLAATVVRPIDAAGAALAAVDPGWGGGLRTATTLGGDPVAVGAFSVREAIGARDVAIDGGKVLVAALQDGLRVVDVSDPADPRPAGHYRTWDGLHGRPSLYEGARAVRVDAARDLVVVADWAAGLLLLAPAP